MRALVSLCLASVLTGLLSCGVAPNSPSQLTGRPALNSLPDPDLTPGELCDEEDRDFEGYRYQERIPHCARNVSREDKITIGKTYGLKPNELEGYEFDHLIPLSVGGSNSHKNVWPLISPEARKKSKLEQEIFNEVSAGRMTQKHAIAKIMAWRPS